MDGDNAALASLQLENQTVARVTAQSDDGTVNEFALTAGAQPGADFADGALDSQMALSSGAEVAYRDVEGGRQEYRARLALTSPSIPLTLTVAWQPGAPDVTIQAATLYDARTGMFTALLPSDRGHFRLAHSGDVKVYENVDVAPRAYLAHQVIPATSPEESLAQMHQANADLSDAAIVEGLDALQSNAHSGDRAEVIVYEVEKVVIQVKSEEPALLVLTDAYYPGWRASVDDEPAPIYPTNHLLRGVAIPPGEHIVTFEFAPTSWRNGRLWSALGALIFVAIVGLLILRRIRSRPESGV
ncbi:MAG: YfhO family protein [Caldilineaceae bacterium]|nr:YfhO family protein [Caldilineaceae bacterium]